MAAPALSHSVAAARGFKWSGIQHRIGRVGGQGHHGELRIHVAADRKHDGIREIEILDLPAVGQLQPKLLVPKVPLGTQIPEALLRHTGSGASGVRVPKRSLGTRYTICLLAPAS